MSGYLDGRVPDAGRGRGQNDLVGKHPPLTADPEPTRLASVTDARRPIKAALIAKPGGTSTGVGRYVFELERGLGAAGVVVERVAPTLPTIPGVPYGLLRRLGIDLRAFALTYPVSARYPPADVYHLTSQNLATLLVFRPPQGKVVVTVHDIIPHILRDDGELSAYRTPADRLLDRLAMAGLKRADLLIADSEYTKRCLVERLGIAAERVLVVYLGVDRQQFRPLAVPSAIREQYRLPRGRRYLIYVGSEDPRKDLPTLWRALASVRRDLPDLELIKVGQPHFVSERRRLESLAGALGLDGSVHFLDEVAEEDLPYLYSLADLCVMPSLYEGFGLPVLEALACGTPVVAADVSSLPELVGDASALFPARNADALASRIRDALASRGNGQSPGRVADRRVLSFSWRRTCAETLVGYERVLGGARA